jgi:hypothetical protein
MCTTNQIQKPQALQKHPEWASVCSGRKKRSSLQLLDWQSTIECPGAPIAFSCPKSRVRAHLINDAWPARGSRTLQGHKTHEVATRMLTECELIRDLHINCKKWLCNVYARAACRQHTNSGCIVIEVQEHAERLPSLHAVGKRTRLFLVIVCTRTPLSASSTWSASQGLGLLRKVVLGTRPYAGPRHPQLRPTDQQATSQIDSYTCETHLHRRDDTASDREADPERVPARKRRARFTCSSRYTSTRPTCEGPKRTYTSSH